jgi:hypothetical protein
MIPRKAEYRSGIQAASLILTEPFGSTLIYAV